jgi:hypothetical protein
MADFANIEITGFQTEEIEKLPDEPLRYSVPFTLSTPASDGWSLGFSQQWQDAKDRLPERYPLVEAKVAGDRILATIDYNLAFNETDPFDKPSFDGVLEVLQEVVKRTNEAYGTNESRERRRLNNLRELLGKLRF